VWPAALALVTGILVSTAMAAAPKGPEPQPGVSSFLAQFRWVERPLRSEGPGLYPTLYRVRSTGELLAAHAGNLRRYEPGTGEWVQAIAGEEGKWGKIVSAPVFCETSRGAVWLETEKGLLCCQGSKTSGVARGDMKREEPGSVLSVIFLPLNFLGDVLGAERLNVTSFCETGDGVLWFGTEGHGLLRCTPSNSPEGEVTARECWASFLKSNNPKIPSDNITALAPGPANAVWVGTDRGLVQWNGEGAVAAPGIDQELTGHVGFIYRARSGRMWVGMKEPPALFSVTSESGLDELTRQARRADPGRDYMYSTPFETRAGETWLRCTRCEPLVPMIPNLVGAGLLRIVERDGSPVFQVHTRDGSAKDPAANVVGGLVEDGVNAVAEDSAGRLWAVGEKGAVSVFDPTTGQWTTVVLPDGQSTVGGSARPLPKLRGVAVAADGSVWFGGKNTIYGLRRVGPKGG